MKINVFRTQLKIGSLVKYKGVEYKVQDFDRTKNEINLSRNKWVRFSEVELLTKSQKNGKKKVKNKVGPGRGKNSPGTLPENADR